MKNNYRKGISLVALVITIIVLIILTVTVILNVGGENSLIGKAKDATKNYSDAEVKEILVARLMEYKAAMVASSKEVGSINDMVNYFEEKGIEISVLTLRDLIGEDGVVFNSKYRLIPCIRGIESAAQETGQLQESEKSSIQIKIYDQNNLFLKLKGSDYLFAVDSQNFQVIGEVKEIGNSSVITDAVKEIEMLEEIIFIIKREGLEINLETLQQNNMYSNLITITEPIDEAIEMSNNSDKGYEMTKLIRNLGEETQTEPGLRIKKRLSGIIAKATFNNSGMVYNIRANGIIESSILGENIENKIREVDMILNDYSNDNIVTYSSKIRNTD